MPTGPGAGPGPVGAGRPAQRLPEGAESNLLVTLGVS